jgi:hypothetical protein
VSEIYGTIGHTLLPVVQHLQALAGCSHHG